MHRIGNNPLCASGHACTNGDVSKRYATLMLRLSQIQIYQCIGEIYHVLCIEAPAVVVVTPKTTTSVNVAVTPSERNTDISFYEAGYQRQVCSAHAGKTPLICSLGDLSSGPRYRVYAMACMAGFECSHRKFADGTLCQMVNGNMPATIKPYSCHLPLRLYSLFRAKTP